MKMQNTVVLLLCVVIGPACSSLTSYHVDAHNGTGNTIDHARVVLSSGKEFSWGAMNPGVDAGMWPMPGPLGRRATVRWRDEEGVEHSQDVDLPATGMWNAVKFVLKPDGTVAVETRWR
jgi:hypothetical protein